MQAESHFQRPPIITGMSTILLGFTEFISFEMANCVLHDAIATTTTVETTTTVATTSEQTTTEPTTTPTVEPTTSVEPTTTLKTTTLYCLTSHERRILH